MNRVLTDSMQRYYDSLPLPMGLTREQFAAMVDDALDEQPKEPSKERET